MEERPGRDEPEQLVVGQKYPWFCLRFFFVFFIVFYRVLFFFVFFLVMFGHFGPY